MKSNLKEHFERLGPVRAVARVPSGSPGAFLLRPNDPADIIKTVSAAIALVQRGMSMQGAKRAMDELLEKGRVYVQVPSVESQEALTAELAGFNLVAVPATAPEVDVKAIRERLGLTQPQFALRFRLDLAALKNWEQKRTMPDTAARNYLRVIERAPDLVEQALDDSGILRCR